MRRITLGDRELVLKDYGSSEGETGRDRLDTLPHAIRGLAVSAPSSTALTAPGRSPQSFAGLWDQVASLAPRLQATGGHDHVRTALVFPNGPELATAFLACLTAGAAAPLNPRYTQPEFHQLLDDLRVDALLIQAGFDSPARAAAAELGIPIVEAEPIADAPAGELGHAGSAGESGELRLPRADEVALLLHTSGTTAKPKVVPLSHANLVASARNIREWLRLTPQDRCLNVMPLFHIHGLMAALLASLSAGASVACTPGFLAPEFFGWVDELEPTWYTAVPTMHQSIVARARQVGIEQAGGGLRFLRSSSAPLAPDLLAELEALFDAPMIEAYGMTEAAHQMTSNPLPPGDRKPGSVGLPTGVEVGVMGSDGGLLAPGEIGEIVIRGPNVTSGYEHNPEANERAFVDGWFRTGDQGAFDDDGYLFIHGRIKELINRGGEKISPREIDEVLMGHPQVAQAMAFALPDTRLGEEVGAVVVLESGAEADEAALLRFAAERLASFKLPRKIVFLDDVPKGPTGKPQRIGLADRLGLAAERHEPPPAGGYQPPASPTERALAKLWAEVLKVERVGVDEPFLALGGDSMLAMLLLARVRDRMQVELSMVEFFEADTVAAQAALIERKRSG